MTDYLNTGAHAGIPETRYFADPCQVPSLTSSIAKTILQRSPRHAWEQHPRLNPNWQPEDPTRFDLGKAAHRLVCGGSKAIKVINAKDYRRQAAKDARDDALAADMLPVTVPQAEQVQAMADALTDQAAQWRLAPFKEGIGELTVVWLRERSIVCRCRLDYLRDEGDRISIFDLKTTDGVAEPDRWARNTLFSFGFDIQASMYVDAARFTWGKPVDFYFIVQETSPPYAASILSLNGEAREYADQKAHRAAKIWGECLDANRWPAYPADVCEVEAPMWSRMDIDAQIIRDNHAGGTPELLSTLTDWQRPEGGKDD